MDRRETENIEKEKEKKKTRQKERKLGSRVDAERKRREKKEVHRIKTEEYESKNETEYFIFKW